MTPVLFVGGPLDGWASPDSLAVHRDHAGARHDDPMGASYDLVTSESGAAYVYRHGVGRWRMAGPPRPAVS